MMHHIATAIVVLQYVVEHFTLHVILLLLLNAPKILLEYSTRVLLLRT